MSVRICNRFYTIEANSDKIRHFKGVPLFDARVREPSRRGTKFCYDKLHSLRQPTVKI